MDALLLIGRILFGVTFISSGVVNHLVGRRAGIEYARGYNAPAPELLVPLSGIAIIAGGLMITFGLWADLGAILIAGFLIGISPIMHAFWKEDDQQMRANQVAHFTKNMALLGGALIIFWLFNQIQGEVSLTITDPLFDKID
jgi:putative oxidoreductase